MPPARLDFDLTDRGWVDLYVKKCESIMQEFTGYVHALQNSCIKERDRCEQLDKDCKRLQTEVKKITQEKNKPQKSSENQLAPYTPEDRNNVKDELLGITEIRTPKESDVDRTTISDGSPAFLNMAMDSEQLQIDASCVLSPAQHREEIVAATEQLNSPTRLSIPMDSIFQHNTSPTCKLKTNNENKSALGFLKARGRVGKALLSDMREHNLREHNCEESEDDVHSRLWKNKGKLQAKRSDWLGKGPKGAERKAAVKRVSTGMDDIQRKRALLSLNKSGERKLKQSRLTQIVPLRANKFRNESVLTTPEYAEDAQKLSLSPTLPADTFSKQKLDFPSFSSETADIFHFSSDDEDDQCTKSIKAKTAVKERCQKSINGIFLQPLPHETEKSESILAITPTAPPIICLDESDDNEQVLENKMQTKKGTRNAIVNHEKTANVKVKQEKSTRELAAAMLAEWEEEEEEDMADKSSTTKLECETKLDIKPRPSQLPAAKISIKEHFNIECDECQKYIDFMGSNMSLAEIEAHLRRCTLHRTTKDCIPVTPPDYWNPLMPSFSDSDPRNKTLLVDPCLHRKRYGDKS
ncbi:PREDICTED: uncharacterized protein LOC108364850 [Rhagoletis zephyria]|uniref:uncharacterized protein LOC108364850 n=1 Tax=Rhagoletis zephyria TaxID=28612 RepID=UPI0008115F45|nr:PREDICTED: uncharacterized protein LOC108364850 [Rhagoletis zephyria]XP_017474188.1 PREDICTED: uncharacterized protein LOC108364850 [Rhagoletis zephyria]